MTANKKKRGKELSPPDKKVFRYWFWLFLIGPAIFFAYYWITTGSKWSTQDTVLPLPQTYRQVGETVEVNGSSLLAGPGGKVIYTSKITFGSNNIVPEGGFLFTVIPLAIPENFVSPTPEQWYLVGNNGKKYDLLKVSENNPAAEEAGYSPLSGNRLVYLVFKVEKEKQDRFLVYTAGEAGAAWKLTR